MITAMDVANFFIDLTNNSKTDDKMTNLRINKLLYFAQGEYLAKYGKPLFEDDMEAWTYGPVVPIVYNTFKPLKSTPIQGVTDEYDPSVFTRDNRLFLIDILAKYGIYSTRHLVEMTHMKGTSWDNVNQSEVIPKESMEAFFRKTETTCQPKEYREECFVGHRDEEGILVLPKEWND